MSAVGLSNYGETYDYFSIMHYESTEGSRNGKNTIEAKVSKYTPLMGKSTDFTSGLVIKYKILKLFSFLVLNKN